MSNEWIWREASEIKTWGVYYHASHRKDWDLAKPVAIQRVEDCNGIRYEARVNGKWVNIEDPSLKNSLWYGPLPRLVRPSEELLSNG